MANIYKKNHFLFEFNLMMIAIVTLQLPLESSVSLQSWPTTLGSLRPRARDLGGKIDIVHCALGGKINM